MAKGKEGLDKDGALQLFGCLHRMDVSPTNFFVEGVFDRFKTAKEFIEGEDGHHSLPYTLEDIAHNVRQFIDAGMAPEKAFATILQNGFPLVHALAFTIAREVEKKAKAAKAGK
jgi:hypothetical protein